MAGEVSILSEVYPEEVAPPQTQYSSVQSPLRKRGRLAAETKHIKTINRTKTKTNHERINTVHIQKYFVTLVAGVLLLVGTVARSQQLQAGDTTVGVVGGRSWSNAQAEWDRLLRDNSKVRHLLGFAEREFGGRVVPTPAAGFQTDVVLRYAKGGVTTDLGVRTVVVPLVSNEPRLPLGSAALEISYYHNTQGLIVPRLLIRRNPSEWHATEYAFRKDGRITEMAARFGDCLFRSSLKIVEQKNPAAHKSLRAAILDLRSPTIGQSELLLASGVISASNVEEEYEAGYVSGTLDHNFKPDRRDNPVVAQAKALAKELLKDFLKYFGGKLWKKISDLFDFDF